MRRARFQLVTFLLFGFIAISGLVYGAYRGDAASPLMAHFDEFGSPVAWITRGKFLELYLGSTLLLAMAGFAVALLTPKGWTPDFVAWTGLTALFGIQCLTLWSERAVLRQVRTRFANDPVADVLFLTSLSLVVSWYLFRWTQKQP